MQYGRPALYATMAFLGVAAWVFRSRPQRRSSTNSQLYLGLDCSTQSLTAVVIDQHQDLVCECSINYEEYFPNYGVVSGVVRCDNNVVVAPTLMFIEALDKILDELRKFVDVGRIVAISGCAQQHGAVFWGSAAIRQLAELDYCFSLRRQLKDCFVISHPPIWMDCSTTGYCRSFEKRMGGAKAVADLSGSRAIERFTGIQISKILEESKEKFNDCCRISLISSMIASVFCGMFVPIDQSDASGMNLMDLKSKCWSTSLIAAAAGLENCRRLKELLGENPIPSTTILGSIAKYFIRRYGFSEFCQIVAFTGDNPSTLAGLGASKQSDLSISLGTSDTVFAVVPSEMRLDLVGSVLVNPVDSSTNMVMLCVKNGSLARETIRNRVASGSWDQFSALLNSTAPAVHRAGVHLFDVSDQLIQLQDVSSAIQVRAVVESQFLSMRYHSNLIGVKAERVIVTGGGSVNQELLAVCANVFNAPVYTSTFCQDTAAFGSALRAQHAYNCTSGCSDFRQKHGLKLCKDPDLRAAMIYEEMLVRFGTMLTKHIIKS